MGWLGKGLKWFAKAPVKIVAGAADAITGAGAAKKAAKTQAESAQAAIDEQRRQYDLTREDLAPSRQVGTGALNQLAAMYGIPGASGASGPADYSAFYNSPDYKFALSEGLKSVENSAAARGGLYSGNAMRALQERGAGIASQNFGNYYNRLASLAGVGQTATNAGASYGANTASNIGNLLTQQGDARASGIIGSANAINGGIRDLASLYGYYKGGGFGNTGMGTPPIWAGTQQQPGWRLG